MLLASGFSIFRTLKHNQKLHNTKISFWKNNWDFQEWEPRQESKIFPREFLPSAIVWVNNSLEKYIYWQNIEKKVLKKTSGPFWEVSEFFFQNFLNGPVIACEQWQLKGFFTRKVKTNDTFLFICLQAFFSLKMFSSFIKPAYYCKQQFSTLNHTILSPYSEKTEFE